MNEQAFPELDLLVRPRRIAVAGVSRDGSSLGGRVFANARANRSGAKVAIVHPARPTIDGVDAVARFADIAEGIDVAFLTVPAAATLDAVRDAAESGARFVVIGSGGFAEAGCAGAALQRSLSEVAAATGVRIVGPNCNGFWNVVDRLNLGFNEAHRIELRLGPVGVVAHTGAVLGAFMLAVNQQGGGLAYGFSTGNEVDLQLPDYVAFMATSPDVTAIVVLLDGVTSARRLEAAVELAREHGKDVYACRFGQSAAGAEAASLHSARLGGGARAFSAWAKNIGIRELPNLDVTTAVAVLASHPVRRRPAGPTVTGLSTSGAGAAMLADCAAAASVTLPTLSETVQRELDDRLAFSAAHNPLDLGGQAAEAGWLEDTLRVLLREESADRFVALLTPLPTGHDRPAPIIDAFVAAHTAASRPLVVYSPSDLPAPSAQALIDAGIPVVRNATTLFDAICIVETQSAPVTEAFADADPATTQRIVAALAELDRLNRNRECLTLLHDDARSVLEPFDCIPFLHEAVVTEAVDITEAGDRIGWPVAIKLLAPEAVHKRAHGGVALAVEAIAAPTRARALLDLAEHAATARLLVQPMFDAEIELFIGVVVDPDVGAVAMAARGGSGVEHAPDLIVRRAPVSPAEATAMINGVEPIRSLRITDGLEAAIAGAGRILAALSQLVIAADGRISSADINPLTVRLDGTTAAVDLRIQMTREQHSPKREPPHT